MDIHNSKKEQSCPKCVEGCENKIYYHFLFTQQEYLDQ